MNVALLSANSYCSYVSRDDEIGCAKMHNKFTDQLEDHFYSMDGIFATTESNILKTVPNIDIEGFVFSPEDPLLSGITQELSSVDEININLENEVFSPHFNSPVSGNELPQDNETINATRDTVITQFKEHLSDHIFKDGEKISLHLHPEELGKITIEMDFARKMMLIETTSAEVDSILRSDLDSLKYALVDSGLDGMNFDFKGQYNEKEVYGCDDSDLEDDQLSNDMETISSIYLLDIFV